MKTGLIIIGDEILSGKRQDKHLGKFIELLTARGMALSWVRYEGDEPDAITATLAAAFQGCDLVFSCGGIGATPDDHTRQCAAKALKRALALHPQAAELIRERMRDVASEQGKPYEPDRADNQHRLNMGVFPEGARIIPNPFNKIAGFSVDHVHFVPGFPVMAWPMMEWVLDTQYAHLHGTGVQVERSLIVKGSMEATLTPLMQAIEAAHPGVRVFSLPCVDDGHLHGRHIDLGVKGRGVEVHAAFDHLIVGLRALSAEIVPEIVR